MVSAILMNEAKLDNGVPMDETQFVNGFDGQDTFCYIKSCNWFAKDIVLDQHGHQISSRKEFHNEIQKLSILKRKV